MRFAGALLAAALLVACSSGGGFDDLATTTSSSTSTTIATTTSTTRPPSATPPWTVFVAEGVDFGTSPPELDAQTEAFAGDEFVREVDAAVAYDSATAAPLADVVVVALQLERFEDESSLTTYVETLAEVLESSLDSGVESFQHEELLVLLLGEEAPSVRELRAKMRSALARGEAGVEERVTPMPEQPAASVFVDLASARFVPFGTSVSQPSGSPTTEPPPPAPPAPVLGGGGAVEADPRQVVVASEIRATAWALAVSLDSFPSAEVLEPQIAALIEDRAGVSRTTVVRNRIVWGSDPGDDLPSVRAFREANIVVLVEGPDPVQLDALVAEWLSRL